MNSRSNGRSTRNTMSAKRPSRSTTPIKECGKLEKVLKKNENEKQKQSVIEEVIEIDLDAEKPQINSKTPTKEEVNGTKEEVNGNKNEENGENGLKEEKNEKESEEVHVECTNGNSVETEAKTNGDEKEENVDKTDEDSINKSDDLMEEPILTLSENDEKLSLQDLFNPECKFESALLPVGNSMTLRSQAQNASEITEASSESVMAKATTSNGLSSDECTIIEESDDTNTDTESINTLEQKVSSTEVVQDQISIQNQSLIANYSGSTLHDISIETNNTNTSNFSDSLNITTESPSYIRSTRNISCRRSLRPLREVSFRNVKRLANASHKKDDTQTSTNVTINTDLNASIGSRINKSLKRERSKTPVDQDDNKRFKNDSATESFFSHFIPSPMAALKRRFYPSQISSSTPKKLIEDDTVGTSESCLQVSSESNNDKKSRCIIM